jgi:hypothetical protein
MPSEKIMLASRIWAMKLGSLNHLNLSWSCGCSLWGITSQYKIKGSEACSQIKSDCISSLALQMPQAVFVRYLASTQAGTTRRDSIPFARSHRIPLCIQQYTHSGKPLCTLHYSVHTPLLRMRFMKHLVKVNGITGTSFPGATLPVFFTCCV